MEHPDPIDVDVGARMRIRRRQLKITQAELAEHLGVTFQQVQKYERGVNRTTASMLVRTAVKLDMTVAELVGECQGSVADGELLNMLTLPGAVDLLRGFTKIEDAKLRAAILELVRSTSTRA